MSNAVTMSNGRRGASRTGRVRRDLQRTTPRHWAKLENSGLVLRGNPDPPRVVLTPWNTVNLSTIHIGGSAASSLCVSITDIVTTLTTQLGVTGTQTFAIRVLSNQVWHLIPNGELNNNVRVRYFSLTNAPDSCETVRTLAQVEDYGTPARNATVRFQWPLVSSNRVFASSAASVVYRLTLEPSQQVLSHTRIMWRFVGGSSTITRQKADGTLDIIADPASLLHNVDADFEELAL